MRTANPCVCWDFTIGEDHIKFDDLKNFLVENCKKWHFQLEEGNDTGFVHYQGRIHLKNKVRCVKNAFPDLPKAFHWSVTMKENMNNFDYVTKDYTRKAGPWASTDTEFMKPIKIPLQIKHVKELWPLQQKVVDSGKPPITDFRHINILCCPQGKKGKSTIALWVECHRLGRVIPFCNDYKDVMRMVMNLEEEWHSNLYIFDMPRGVEKRKLFQFFAAIESIKDGRAFDDRYRFKQMHFDTPAVWIFTNKIPDQRLLSRDRWLFWLPFDLPTGGQDMEQVSYKELKEHWIEHGYDDDQEEDY